MLLTASMSATADHHGHDAGAQHQAIGDTDDHSPEETVGDGCEHCGHLAGHLLGLLGSADGLPQDRVVRILLTGDPVLAGRLIPPRLRPPKA